jgi:hypothetical protein
VPDFTHVSIHTITGAIEEKFNTGLRRVLEDIANPAKQAEANRELVIRVKIKPDGARSSAVIESDVDVKLARSKPTKSFMLITLGEDGPEASVSTAKQLTLQEQLDKKTEEKEA